MTSNMRRCFHQWDCHTSMNRTHQGSIWSDITLTNTKTGKELVCGRVWDRFITFELIFSEISTWAAASFRDQA